MFASPAAGVSRAFPGNGYRQIEETVDLREPFCFALHSSIFNLEKHRLPYHYNQNCWRTQIQFESASVIPIEVLPDSPRRTAGLNLVIYSELSSAERKDITNLVKAVFCTDATLGKIPEGAGSEVFESLASGFAGLKPHLSQDPFQSLIKILVRQMIGAEQAKRIITRITTTFGLVSTIGDKEFNSFPTPVRLSRATKHELLKSGVGFKWRYIRQVARLVRDGDLDFSELNKLSDDKALDALKEIAGIGQWSAEVFLFDGMHRLGVYPTFDITIQRALEQLSVRTEVPKADLENRLNEFDGGCKGIFATYLFAYFRESKRLEQG
jgi:3-methyladenine DNA glycosylase/8-oxoguanine DNA glycosylase